MVGEKKIKISELIPDDKNFNKGSEFGQGLIEKSFQKFGAGRSILIDKNNRIIAGNKSTENYGSVGGEDVIVIESDGSQLIAVKRTDIDLDTPQGREMALADNATAKANIVWAEEVIAEEIGVEIAESWGVKVEKEINNNENKDLSDNLETNFRIEVICKDENQQEKLYNELIEKNYECRLLTL